MPRSLLFVPGDRPAMIRKSRQLDADMAIWDLEDGVLPDARPTARALVAHELSTLPLSNVPILVRINAITTNAFRDDLEAVVGPTLHGVLVPKMESAAHVERLDRELSHLESMTGVAPGSIKIHCLLETCLGVMNAQAVAGASARVESLCFGAEDFTLDLGVPRTREGKELQHARATIALAAGAAKILAIDAVYSDVADTDGLEQECVAARGLGFRGKLAIHPCQVGPINRAFSPSETERARARRILEAFASASARGNAVATLDGQMIDAPIAERAMRLLAQR